MMLPSRCGQFCQPLFGGRFRGRGEGGGQATCVRVFVFLERKNKKARSGGGVSGCDDTYGMKRHNPQQGRVSCERFTSCDTLVAIADGVCFFSGAGR